MKPVIKFNNGRGAILCCKCSVIIKENLSKDEFEGKTKLLYCDKCFMKNTSKQISYLLRHNPEDLKMDKRGWVKVEDLLKKLGITQQELDYIVETNDKKRFGYDNEKVHIRAHQGHSEKLNLRIEYDEIYAPVTYYHGTNSSDVSSILKKGLIPMKRSHVHLSKDVMTATTVGMRHGSDVTILAIDGGRMKLDGYKLYLSDNNVVLADEVPPKYIKIWN